MSAFKLRPYQNKVIEKARGSVSKGKKRIIIHAPTGAGKTVIASHLISLARDKGTPVLFIANRRELVFQAHRTLLKCGIDAGIIMNGEKADLTKMVQVASMQTYIRRINLEDKLINPWFHDAKMIIVDECHGSVSRSYQKILQGYPEEVVVIGLTATPCRADGRGLGQYYDEIVSSIGIGQLIGQEYLTPIMYYTPSTPDLEKIRITKGDYEKKELGKRANTPKLVGDIVENWLKVAGDRQTIVFAVNVKHSLHIVEQFQQHRIAAAHIDAKTPIDKREDTLNRLSSGELQVVSNVGILTEGFDYPAASCIVLARPTKSLGLYLQMAGRGIRPYPEKINCILLDHGGCVQEHGLIERDREWILDDKKKAWSSRQKINKERSATVKCQSCNLVFEGSGTCPDCGSPVERYGKKVDTVEGELREHKLQKVSLTEKRVYFGMLKYWEGSKGYKVGFALARYQSRFGCWPHHSIGDVRPIEPDEKFKNRMIYEQIRHSKSRRKA